MAEVGASDAVKLIRGLRYPKKKIKEVADHAMSLVNTLRRTRWLLNHSHLIEKFEWDEEYVKSYECWIEDALETFVVDVAAMIQRNESGLIKRFIRKIFPQLYYVFVLENMKKNISEFDHNLHNFKHLLDRCIDNISNDPLVASQGQRRLRKTYPRRIGENFVGMVDELEELVSLVLEMKTRVISIWGVAGLGKTTIAAKIYEDPMVRRFFYAGAWVCLSEGCEISILLLNILRQLSPKRVNEGIQEETLIDQLKEVLSKRPCLIVLDNVQDMDQLRQLSPALQMGGGRSVILLTTREENIANVGSPHKLRLLNEDEAWNLLNKHVFPRKDAPG